MLTNNKEKAKEILKTYNRKMGLIYKKITSLKPLSSLKLPETLPSKVDLRNQMTPIKDQGPLGTCASFAGAGAKEYYDSKEYNKMMDLSEYYLYYYAKKLDGYPNEEGTTLEAIAYALQLYGICEENYYPYNPNHYPEDPPSDIANKNAKKYIITNFYSLDSVDDIKKALYQEGAIYIGVLVAENFMSPKNGFIPIPDGNVLGGHALCVAGYDDSLISPWGNKGAFIVKNSWGTSWGDKGYCYIPYDVMNWVDKDGYIPFYWGGIGMIDYIEPQKITIEMWIGKDTAKVNGKDVKLDQPPIIDPKSNRTLIPVRFVAENLGCQVDWDGTHKKITIKQL